MASAAPASINMAAKNHALVLFAHGARDPQWAEPFVTIQRRIAAANPDASVVLAFLEIMEPSLPVTVQKLAGQGITRITLVPLFMAQGGHLKEDLPKLVRSIEAKHPGLHFHVTPAIGEVGSILDAIADWAEHEYRKGGG